ncbi:UDP-N-acetylmuramate dehydrogenase [Phycisphaerales bacterium]|nr:UDP-N-acetylmuramate dehydrogenase [Phycisphaerales bacterium]
MPTTAAMTIQKNAPIPTWFGIGGRADRLLAVRSDDDIRRGLEIDRAALVLGDGANLLVDDAGVGELVLAMEGYCGVEFADGSGVVAQAGADLSKLIHETARRGLAGLEGLIGIPASVGGAAVMNAGGKFGQIADVIRRVHAISRGGSEVTLERRDIHYGYRRSGLNDLVIRRVEFGLMPEDPGSLRARVKDVMAYKKGSQPLAASSAGCCFKNPTLRQDVRDERGEIGRAGERVSAGMLIDRAGLKGLRVRGAVVSERHANFLVPDKGAAARDVIDLMEQVERRVLDRFGVVLEREVVVWRRK